MISSSQLKWWFTWIDIADGDWLRISVASFIDGSDSEMFLQPNIYGHHFQLLMREYRQGLWRQTLLAESLPVDFPWIALIWGTRGTKCVCSLFDYFRLANCFPMCFSAQVMFPYRRETSVFLNNVYWQPSKRCPKHDKNIEKKTFVRRSRIR